ncbi:hypothetical protein EYF80_018549 [Liparis tanakae]|uniref:Uncharacterized protein n=1 Tax=Liparis tanakae TaxID=230148 RepID=A0A4Z2I062_9TELE|nr:hypothetical protein EYF80_018549 [Liparis tanakae]
MSASCWYTSAGSQNCSARSNTFFRLSSVPYMFSRLSRATHTFSFSCSSLDQHKHEGPLGHGAGLLDLGGLQMVSHVLEPEQGAVGGGEEQALEGAAILGPQARIHELRLALHQGLLRRLLLLLELVARPLLGLAGGERRGGRTMSLKARCFEITKDVER